MIINYKVKKFHQKKKKRPYKTKHSGSGTYGCVVNCKSAQQKVDSKAKVKLIIFFPFSKNPKKKKSMASKHNKILAKRRQNNPPICEFHFDSGNINVSMGQEKKVIKRTVVPTFDDMKVPVV